MEFYEVLLTRRCCWGNLVQKAESPPQISVPVLLVFFFKTKSGSPLFWGQGDKQTLSHSHGVVLHSWSQLRCCSHGRHESHPLSLMWWCQRKGNCGEDTHPVKEISQSHSII